MRAWLFCIGCVIAACGGKVEGADGGGGGGDGGGGGGGGIDAGPSPGFRDCKSDGDCVIVPATCCGTCGAATKTDQIAVAKSKASEYRASVCKSTACPACAMMQDPSLKARCTNGLCEVAP